MQKCNYYINKTIGVNRFNYLLSGILEYQGEQV